MTEIARQGTRVAIEESEVERIWLIETDRRAAQIASGDVELSTLDRLLDRIDERRPSSPTG